MSQVDSSPVTEKNMLDYAAGQSEPFLFGIEDEAAEAFLTKLCFSWIQNVTSDDCKRVYFHEVNKDRSVCSLLSFVHAVVE